MISVIRRVWTIVALILTGTSAFLITTRTTYIFRPSCHLFLSQENDMSSSSSTNKEDWQGFNPFDPSSTKPSFTSNNKISLRKTQMQTLMSELLNVVDEPDAMAVILSSNKDLLIEPLEDDEAVLEIDSIYKPGMTRSERYQVYRTTMEERIATARNPSVRVVLQNLADFVLSHE
eukprot:scaffold287_cov173-Amphora_coffeaeformis.AAC.8